MPMVERPFGRARSGVRAFPVFALCAAVWSRFRGPLAAAGEYSADGDENRDVVVVDAGREGSGRGEQALGRARVDRSDARDEPAPAAQERRQPPRWTL